MRTEWELVLQLAAGLVFLLSGLAKLRAPREFIEGTAEYEVLPSFLIAPASVSIIVLELAVAVAFLSGWGLAVATPVALCLLLVFIVVTLATLWRGKSVECMCFGAGETLSWVSLVRLVVLTAGVASLMLFAWRSASRPLIFDWEARKLLSAALCAILGLTAVTWCLSVPDVLGLHRKCRTCGGGDS